MLDDFKTFTHYLFAERSISISYLSYDFVQCRWIVPPISYLLAIPGDREHPLFG
jgi:hypothetical protein